jgi:hypothetical protein
MNNTHKASFLEALLLEYGNQNNFDDLCDFLIYKLEVYHEQERIRRLPKKPKTLDT